MSVPLDEKRVARDLGWNIKDVRTICEGNIETLHSWSWRVEGRPSRREEKEGEGLMQRKVESRLRDGRMENVEYISQYKTWWVVQGCCWSALDGEKDYWRLIPMLGVYHRLWSVVRRGYSFWFEDAELGSPGGIRTQRRVREREIASEPVLCEVVVFINIFISRVVANDH